jgi:hypothetical protein
VLGPANPPDTVLHRGPEQAVKLRWLVGPVAALACLQVTSAQTRFTYSSGQVVSPAYEGWRPNEDGFLTMVFGYMNQNWAEEFDVPIGPDNNIEPGGPDQGSRRISTRGATRSCSRSACRRILVTRN